jgi:hypothetical protein
LHRQLYSHEIRTSASHFVPVAHTNTQGLEMAKPFEDRPQARQTIPFFLVAPT